MSFAPNTPVNILVCYGKERGTKYPHWMVMLVSDGGRRGTWYHSVGGPTQDKPYEVAIEAEKRIDSHGIQSMELVGTIDPKDVKKVTAAAKRTPAQQCQRYVVHLVDTLEKKGLANAGEAKRLNAKVQMSERARAFAEQNPIDHPSGAYVPPPGETASSGSRVPGSGRDRQSPQRTTGASQASGSGRTTGASGSQSQSQSQSQRPSSSKRAKSKRSGKCMVM